MCKNMDLDDWISIKHIVPLCEPIARYALLLLWLQFRLAMLFRSLLPARLISQNSVHIYDTMRLVGAIIHQLTE
jgi:hypothetical protein